MTIIASMEFLVAIDVQLPHDLDVAARAELLRAESDRGALLAEQGIIGAIWRVPGRLANRGIWSAADATTLHDAIVSLPLWPFMTVDVVPLARHSLAQHCRGLAPGTLAPWSTSSSAAQ
jgi:muconolactone D-isomerase